MQVAVRAKKLTPNRPAAVVTAQGPWVLTDAGLFDLAGDCAARRGIIRSGYAAGFHPAHSWPFRPRGSLFDAWHEVPVYARWSCPTSLTAPATRRPTPPWAVACWRISRLPTLKIPMILVRGCGYFPSTAACLACPAGAGRFCAALRCPGPARAVTSGSPPWPTAVALSPCRCRWCGSS